MNQIAFVDLQFAAKPGTSGSACLAHVSETPFQQFAAFALQAFALVRTDTLAILAKGGFRLPRLVRPATRTCLTLRIVGSHTNLSAVHQRLVGVVSLVGHGLFYLHVTT